MKFQFQKYEGLGNDFLLLDQIADPTIPTPSSEQIQRMCDRRFGVGADGILLFCKPDPEAIAEGIGDKAVRMIYFNADGSRAETCFNGLRCIALHAAKTDPAYRILPGVDAPLDSYPILIQADTGLLHAGVHPEKDQVRIAFTVGSGFDPVGSVGDLAVPIPSEAGLTLKGLTVSMGNPHFVLWRNEGELDDLNRLAVLWGRGVETSPLFPAGTNFEIAVKTAPDHLRMAVWERGVGITLACGSGATATVCSAVSRDIFPAGQPVAVEMAGGAVTVTVHPGTILVEGPANRVYHGIVDPANIKLRTK